MSRAKWIKIYLALILSYGCSNSKSQLNSYETDIQSSADFCGSLASGTTTTDITLPDSYSFLAGETLEMGFSFQSKFPISLDTGLKLEMGATLTQEISPGAKFLRFACVIDTAKSNTCTNTMEIPIFFGGNYQIKPFLILTGETVSDDCVFPSSEIQTPPKIQTRHIQEDPRYHDVFGPKIEHLKLEQHTFCEGDDVYFTFSAIDEAGVDLTKLDSHFTRPGEEDYHSYPELRLTDLGESRYRGKMPLRNVRPGTYEIQFLQVSDKLGNYTRHFPPSRAENEAENKDISLVVEECGK